MKASHNKYRGSTCAVHALYERPPLKRHSCPGTHGAEEGAGEGAPGCAPGRGGTAAPPGHCGSARAGDLPAPKVTRDAALTTQAPAADSVLEWRKISVTATSPVQQNSGDKWSHNLLCKISYWFDQVVKPRKPRVIFSL